ncbi:MAG: SMP-30/gluconolactonase/LRE family protein, partial [Streptosporangiaceae bacterium]
TYDAVGDLLVCEHVTSSVVRERADGSTEVVASQFRGRPLNSPNDVIVKSDGTIYFTDPTYGRTAEFGLKRRVELPFRGVYRVRPGDPEPDLLIDDFGQPNGLCFSPDESLLYVNDTTGALIRVFEVRRDGALAAEQTLLGRIGSGRAGDSNPDGMKCDEQGNVYVTGPGGIWVISPRGQALGVIEVPEKVGNLNWGGPDWRSLFICASASIYRIELKVSGNRLAYMR